MSCTLPARLRTATRMLSVLLSLLVVIPVVSRADDIAAQLDSTNGATAFIVLDAASNELFRIRSDGHVMATGQVDAAVFAGSGALLDNLRGSAITVGSISNAQLAANAVRGVNIQNDSIQSRHIAGGQVQGVHLGADAVSMVHLARAYQSGTYELAVLASTNNADFSPIDTDAAIAFPGVFASSPVATVSIQAESDASADAVACRLTGATRSNLTVRVRSDAGASAQTLEDDIYYDPWLSMTTVNGNPAVAYSDSDGTLLFQRAVDPLGIAWGDPVVVYTNADGMYPSLAIVAGRPAISFSKGSGSTTVLSFLRALNASGTAWGDIVEIVTNHATLGLDHVSSLAVVAGQPAIAFQESGTHADTDIQFVRATDPIGSSWGAIQTLENCGGVDEIAPPSLQIINGNPAIAYVAITSNRIHFLRAADIWGNTWNGIRAAVTSYVRRANFSMAVIDGNPAIAYFSDAGDDLTYVRATDINGSAWSPASRIYTNGSCGWYPCLAEVGGAPCISFDGANNELLFLRAADSTGASWDDPVTIDTNAASRLASCIGEVVNNPAIVWHGPDGAELRYVRAGNLPPDTFLNWIAVEP